MPTDSSAFDRVADLLHRRIGLRAELSVRSRLDRCIRDGASSLEMDLDSYLAHVMLGNAAFERLLDDVTVQESAFFRHPEHFEVLARDLLPGFRRPVQIWSVGCANGQEAFSLAMMLDEFGVDGSVVATDLSTAALERTRAGLFTAREVLGLSPARVERYLTLTDEGWLVAQTIRDRVRTAAYNLVDPVPAAVRSSQVIFCRNVLIYLSSAHTRTFLSRLADAFPEGTPLFLGGAEVLWQITDRFEPVQLNDTFFHRVRPPPTSLSIIEDAEGQPERPRDRRHAAVDQPPRVVAQSPSSPTAVSLPDAPGDAAASFAQTGQRAMAAGDHQSAVVAFRARAYLDPDDPIAQMHLAIALEAAGDRVAARRAFGVASRTLLATDPALVGGGKDSDRRAAIASLIAAHRRVVSP